MSVEPVNPAGHRLFARESPGWYGKLATLGDFAHRRLAPDFVRMVDGWLSRAMSASREPLGDRWLGVYLTAPVMRFAWAPGVVGDAGADVGADPKANPRDDAHWWFGTLMPSCDNVGRYYPLLIAQRRPKPPLDRIALDHLDAWYGHLADAAAHTLGEHASVESFEESLASAPPWPTPGSGPTLTTRPMAHGECYPLGALGLRAGLTGWLAALAVDDLQTRFKGCSLWWRPGDIAHETTARVVRGLPEPAAFAEMLSGE